MGVAERNLPVILADITIYVTCNQNNCVKKTLLVSDMLYIVLVNRT